MWTKWDPIEYYFYCTLIVVLSWPEDGRSRPKYVAKYYLIVIIASCLMYVVYWRCIIYYTNLIIHNGMASLSQKKVGLYKWIQGQCTEWIILTMCRGKLHFPAVTEKKTNLFYFLWIWIKWGSCDSNLKSTQRTFVYQLVYINPNDNYRAQHVF